MENGAVRSEETRERGGEPMKRAKEERKRSPSGQKGHKDPLGGVWLSEERDYRGAALTQFKQSPGRANGKVFWDAA